MHRSQRGAPGRARRRPGGPRRVGRGGDLVLANDLILTQELFEGCSSVTAGPNWVVGLGGVVTLRAGQIIRLANGFSVLVGAVLRAELAQ